MYPNHSWQRDRNSPFAFFLGIISNYVHPDSGSTVDELKELVDYPEPSEAMLRFKDEFRRLLSGELDQLPPSALSTAAEFSDGSEEAFLRRLWRELYGDEPVQPVTPGP